MGMWANGGCVLAGWRAATGISERPNGPVPVDGPHWGTGLDLPGGLGMTTQMPQGTTHLIARCAGIVK
jgi:hypothetical protein